jgi:hypothetical protein
MSGIVTFEDGILGSASAELSALGVEVAAEVLLYCQEVYSGRVDYRRFKVFASYHGIEMFLAKISDDFIVFSVEVDGIGDLKVTIMFAGRHGVTATAGGFTWDGNNYAALSVGVIRPRAIALFR